MTRALAPVASGTFCAVPINHSFAKSAKHAASFAPSGKPSTSSGRTGIGASLRISPSTMNGFRQPPPERYTPSRSCFGSTNRSYARTVASMVNAVSVASRSFGRFLKELFR